MKAMTLREYGEPNVLNLEQLPLPEAAPGEVRIEVHAVSINPVDYKVRRTGLFNYTDFPVILGWDVSGVVDSLGEGVVDFKIGDEVYGMIRFPQEGRAYAEYVTASASDLAHKPSNLSHVEAAAMTLAPLTAHQAFERMNLQAGQSILIHAGAGGVGHFAVQLAKARGAKVIATASRHNRDFVLSLGADEVIDYHVRPFEEQVSLVDAVLDTVGGETLPRSFAVIKPGGWLVSIAGQPSAEQAQSRGIHAERILVYPSRPHLDVLSALAQTGQLKPHVSQTFKLENVADAHRAQETQRTVGKIVLTVT